MTTTRRDFLTTTVSLAAGAAAFSAASRLGLGQAAASAPATMPLARIPTPESTREGDMLYRKLGNTGEKISLLGLGGFHFAGGTEAQSTRLLRKAVDAGVTFMDNCWDYRNGVSEQRMGAALRDGYRNKVFLMTKIDGRTKEAAAAQINDSLKRLQTDVIDLMQIHENIKMEDADLCFTRGCIEALVEAKKAGRIRYIGFTGHKDPSIHLHMLGVAAKNNFRFDAVQMPLNVLDAHFHSFANEVVPRLVKEGIAVLAMKTMAGGSLARGNLVTPTECLHYAMNLSTSTVISGITSEEELAQNLDAVKTFKPLTEKQLADLLAKTRDLALRGTSEGFKTTNGYDGTIRNPSWTGL